MISSIYEAVKKWGLDSFRKEIRIRQLIISPKGHILWPQWWWMVAYFLLNIEYAYTLKNKDSVSLSVRTVARIIYLLATFVIYLTFNTTSVEFAWPHWIVTHLLWAHQASWSPRRCPLSWLWSLQLQARHFRPWLPCNTNSWPPDSVSVHSSFA